MSNLVYQNYSNKCKGWTNPSSISLGPQITSLSDYHSPAGSTTIITINGYNFYSYSQIVFGILNPTVYFINSTILQFYIPTNLTYGIYPVQVFNGAIGSNIVTYTLDDTNGLTKSEADTLYLSKVHTDTSNAPLTTFNGALNIGSTATFNGDLNVYSTATFYSYAPLCGITATSGNELVNKDYVDNAFNTLSSTLSTFNNILNFSSNAFTNLKKSIVYNFNTTTTITKSNVKAKLSNYANNSQVYTFGQSIPNRWVAVGTRPSDTISNINTIAYSSDGFNWIGSSSGNTIFSNASGVAWNGTMWVAVGSGSNTIAYSSDGITWIGSTSGNSVFTSQGQGIGIAWNGTMWVAVGGANTGSINTIAYSYYGATGWIGVTGSDNFFNYGFGVAWNGTMWIAVGGGDSRPNTIVYSYNGINWTGLGNTFFSGWAGSGVAWNGTMWVAVGEGNPSIIYSYNGLDWIGVTGSNSIFYIGKGVAWNGTMWTAVGGSNGDGGSPYTIAYSYNGINWTGVTGSTGILRVQGYGVAWNGTMWTAVGGTTPYAYNNQGSILSPYTIAYSYNGVNWTGLSGSTGIFQCYGTGIAFNNKRPNTITFPTNLMVLGGKSSTKTIAYSYDGTVWTGITGSNSTFNDFMLGVAWNGTMWVGVGAGTNSIAYSYNGVTGWTGVTGSTSIFNDRGLRVAWNGNLWVAVGGANTEGSPYTIAYSYDGIVWAGVTGSTGIFSFFGKGIAWNGTMWVAVGRNDSNYSIAYSYYGATGWTGITGSINILSRGYDVAWNGTMWVAVGGVGALSYRIVYSYDGLIWTPVTNSTNIFSSSGQCVAWNGQMWVAGGEGTNTIAYSYNGTTWTSVTSLNNIWSSGTASSVIWNGQKWIMTGYTNPKSNIMAYSTDGIEWTGINKSVSNINGNIIEGYAIGWNAGLCSVNIPGSTGSIVLNPGDQLDVVCDSYYNTGFTNCAISINST